jgi:hypothetical protein
VYLPFGHERRIGCALVAKPVKGAPGLGYRTIVATIATDNRTRLQM